MLDYTDFVPVSTKTVDLGDCALFSQESYFLKDGRFVNLYWTEFDKNAYKFRLINLLGKKPLIKIVEKFGGLAAINTCNFYLVDVGKQPPICAYNLFVRNGCILQLPSSNRTTIIERRGELEVKYLKAEGALKIGKKTFRWTGQKDKNEGILVVHGVFDIMFAPMGRDKKRRAKRAIKTTTIVSCNKDTVLLGIKLNNKNKPIVGKISHKQVCLLNYCYVLEADSNVANSIVLGDHITNVTIDNHQIENNENIASLSFSLPKNAEQIKDAVTREVLATDKGIIKPLTEDYLKSWSLVLLTQKRVIFFLVDSYPYKKGQEGINVYELHNLLSSKFDFEVCGICDGGQTSKLFVRSKNVSRVFGNMHYVDYSQDRPRRDSFNGRPTPSALIAYER